ncbi:ZIP family metal transporter, partial [Pseudomonas putida]|nr:ZIP family metal transporter [Pseudomonas putida]
MSPAHSQSAAPSSLLHAWRQQVANTPWLSAGLGLSLLAVVALLAASFWNAVNGDHADNLHLAVLGGLSGFGATALGAVLAVVLRDVSARNQDVMLGFAAGMMLAASSFSLILPGLD